MAILTDIRDAQKFRRYVKIKEPLISVPALALWKDQGRIITPETAEAAIRAGSVPDSWAQEWDRSFRVFVRDNIAPAWIRSISHAGAVIAKAVNDLAKKDFVFDDTMARVKAWIDSQGGKLIVDLSATQMKTIHALLQAQITLGVTSPYILAQRLKPLVGLTNREAKAVSKFIATLAEEGTPAALINARSADYARFLHKRRAARIAQTEISNGYWFGQMDSLRQSISDGWLKGIPEKSWLAGGPNPCEICEENEAAGSIPIEEPFPSGDDRPTAHPSCACALGITAKAA